MARSPVRSRATVLRFVEQFGQMHGRAAIVVSLLDLRAAAEAIGQDNIVLAARATAGSNTLSAQAMETS